MSKRPHATRRTIEAEAQAADLLGQVGALLRRLSAVQGPDIISLPIILPTDLAALLDDVASASGVPVPFLYSSCLILGAWHSAHENGHTEAARRIAGIFRRYAPEQEWARWVARHPEAQP